MKYRVEEIAHNLRVFIVVLEDQNLTQHLQQAAHKSYGLTGHVHKHMCRYTQTLITLFFFLFFFFVHDFSEAVAGPGLAFDYSCFPFIFCLRHLQKTLQPKQTFSA